jgi:hypothetical protein
MAQNAITAREAIETVPISAFVPRQLRVDLEQLARRHDRSLSAELRQAIYLYLREKRG